MQGMQLLMHVTVWSVPKRQCVLHGLSTHLVDVVHHLLRSRPRLVLGVVLQQDEHHGGDVVHTCGGLLQRLCLTQILR